MSDLPYVGQAVCELTRRGKLLTGEVIDIRDDGMYVHFAVRWDVGGATEYPLRCWGDRVSPRMCRFCDSPYHWSADEGECRQHFA